MVEILELASTQLRNCLDGCFCFKAISLDEISSKFDLEQQQGMSTRQRIYARARILEMVAMGLWLRIHSLRYNTPRFYIFDSSRGSVVGLIGLLDSQLERSLCSPADTTVDTALETWCFPSKNLPLEKK